MCLPGFRSEVYRGQASRPAAPPQVDLPAPGAPRPRIETIRPSGLLPRWCSWPFGVDAVLRCSWIPAFTTPR